MRKTIALAAVAAALASTLTGCAGQSAGAFQPFDPGAGADGATTYDRIITALLGTSEDRLAAEARMTADLQHSIAACMKAAGHSYTPAPSERTAGGPQTPGDLTTLAPIGAGHFGLADFKRGVAEAADKISNPGYTKLTTDAQRDDYSQALNACANAAPQPEAFRPADSIKLVGELEQMFLAIEARPEIAAKLTTYGTCLKEGGFAATDYLSLYLLVQDQFPEPSDGWAKMSASKQWTDAVAYEQRAAAADATCRSDLRDTAMGIAAPQLQRFAAEHAVQLQQASGQWAARRTQK